MATHDEALRAALLQSIRARVVVDPLPDPKPSKSTFPGAITTLILSAAHRGTSTDCVAVLELDRQGVIWESSPIDLGFLHDVVPAAALLRYMQRHFQRVSLGAFMWWMMRALVYYPQQSLCRDVGGFARRALVVRGAEARALLAKRYRAPDSCPSMLDVPCYALVCRVLVHGPLATDDKVKHDALRAALEVNNLTAIGAATACICCKECQECQDCIRLLAVIRGLQRRLRHRLALRNVARVVWALGHPPQVARIVCLHGGL
jgi:hypothetical protein